MGSSGQPYRSARCWRCGVKHSPTEDCGSSPAATPPAASTSPETEEQSQALATKKCATVLQYRMIKKTSTSRLALLMRFHFQNSSVGQDDFILI